MNWTSYQVPKGRPEPEGGVQELENWSLCRTCHDVLYPCVLAFLDGELHGACIYAESGDPGVLVRIALSLPEVPSGHLDVVTGPVQLFWVDPKLMDTEVLNEKLRGLLKKGRSPTHRTSLPYMDFSSFEATPTSPCTCSEEDQ